MPDNPGEEAGISSRFVVDILSGTSAGGINAIYLAKALANGQDFDALRRLWLDEADINLLFNEPRAYRGLQTPSTYTKPPQSLLAGPRLYDRALNALTKMGGATETGATASLPVTPRYAEQIDLSVTATDLQGLWLALRLADGSVEEPRHRTAWRCRILDREGHSRAHIDFTKDNDRMLALAARATSSFPFAFEPVLPRDADGSDSPLGDAIGNAFFPDYVRAKVPWREWAFADGGYLDNKPFTYATNALRRRRADVPVDRKLLYIEPDPSRLPADRNKSHGRPDAVGHRRSDHVPRVERSTRTSRHCSSATPRSSASGESLGGSRLPHFSRRPRSRHPHR